MSRRGTKKLSEQMKVSVKKEAKKIKTYEGNTEIMISTGSTLLDLAISGTRKKGGGLPGGVLVEVFGPSSSGKTVLLCEIAGAVQRQGGAVLFHDPEARLNKQFAALFDMGFDEIDYETPDTVNQVFIKARNWEPKGKAKINGQFVDSLAALSTEMEMGNEEGDKMGMKRAKDFSEQLRKTCRILKQENWLMVCSNQIRVNTEAVGKYSEKTSTPGGVSVGFYASIRLRARKPQKIYDTVKVAGKEIKRVVGIETEIEVYKSSVDRPHRIAKVIIIFDYGIDDIRTNLQFIKDYTKNNIYTVGGETLDKSMSESIAMVEEQGLEKKLKQEVIELWEKIESKFDSNRKRKQR